MKKRGFTTIELLVAMALSASLMVAVTGILGLIAKQQKEVLRTDTWKHRAIRNITWDLETGTNLSVGTNQFEILGYGALSPDTKTPELRPVRVRYYVDQTVDGPRLLRSQTYLDETRENVQVEVVSAGVSQLSLIPLDEIGAKRLQRNLIPNRLRLVMTHGESNTVIRSLFIGN